MNDIEILQTEYGGRQKKNIRWGSELSQNKPCADKVHYEGIKTSVGLILLDIAEQCDKLYTATWSGELRLADDKTRTKGIARMVCRRTRIACQSFGAYSELSNFLVGTSLNRP